MKTEIEATYGSNQTPCTVFIEECSRGRTYYAVDGSSNVNCTYEELCDGVDVETIDDCDYFSWSDTIESHEDLVKAIEA